MILLALALLAAVPRYPLVASSDPTPARLVSTAPRTLAYPKGCGCRVDTLKARSWMRLEIGLQLRAVDWAHPRFDPVVVATGPEVAPGTTSR